MKKCFDITRLLCLSVLLSVFCFSSVLAAPAGEAPALRVALLLEDAAPDQGWNDLLRQGLEQARKELGVRTAVVVAPPQGSNGLTQEGIFRAAARQADLVLLSGARLHEILRNNAANFRQTKFGCIDTGIRAANIMCVTFADEQAAFLAGALLSQLHRHGLLPAPRTRAAGDELTLGWLAGEDDPQLKSMLNGFVEGVRLESPGAVLDISACPDLGPVLFAAAVRSCGAVFTGTRRLRIKESDRATAMARELARFGAEMAVEDDRVTVLPRPLHAPEEMLDGHNDHRVVMALAVLCASLGGTIRGAEAVSKSWPDFFRTLQALGVRMEIQP